MWTTWEHQERSNSKGGPVPKQKKDLLCPLHGILKLEELLRRKPKTAPASGFERSKETLYLKDCSSVIPNSFLGLAPRWFAMERTGRREAQKQQELHWGAPLKMVLPGPPQAQEVARTHNYTQNQKSRLVLFRNYSKFIPIKSTEKTQACPPHRHHHQVLPVCANGP